MPVKKKVTSIEQIRDRYLLVESRNKQKKEHLDSLKTEYANLAKEVFASEQQLLKMIEAFKIQNKKVSSETKDYVDCCAQLALKEAECDYSLFLEKDFNFQLVEENKKNEVNDLRDRLKLSLDIYRDCKTNFLTRREEIAEENEKLQQECFDTLFYCENIKINLMDTIKTSLHNAGKNESPPDDIKSHIKNVDNTIAMVAERILVSRDELKGFFKNQIQKMHRELRIMEEAEKLRKKKEKDNTGVEINQQLETHELDKFLKKNNFMTDPSSPNGRSISSPTGGLIGDASKTAPIALSPKPPPLQVPSNILNSMSVGKTARSRRTYKHGKTETVNMEMISQEFVVSCETQGKLHKLKSYKESLQSHVLYQLSLLMLCHEDLRNKFNNSGSSSSNIELKGHKTNIDNNNISNGNDDRIMWNNEDKVLTDGAVQDNVLKDNVDQSISTLSLKSRLFTTQMTTSHFSKTKARKVNIENRLACGVDNLPSAHNYIETGLQYSQTLTVEALALESKGDKLHESILKILIDACEKKTQLSSLPDNESSLLQQENLVPVLRDASFLDVPNNSNDNNSDNEYNDDGFDAESTASQRTKTKAKMVHGKTIISLPKGNANSPSRFSMVHASLNKTHYDIGLNMQEQHLREVALQKQRDHEREQKLLEKKIKNLDGDNIGIREWTKENYFRHHFHDLLVTELGAESDVPIELALAKLASVAVYTTTENDGDHDDKKTKNNSFASYQPRQVLISGLSSLC